MIAIKNHQCQCDDHRIFYDSIVTRLQCTVACCTVPAEDFLALDPVFMIDPSLSTAVRFSTFSRIDPYRTAVDPLHRQAHMPGR